MHSQGGLLLLLLLHLHDQLCPLSLGSEVRALWMRPSSRELMQASMQCGSPLHTRWDACIVVTASL